MKKNSKGFMLIDTLIVSITVSAILIYLYFQFSNVNASYSKSFKYNTVPGLYSGADIKENILHDGKPVIYSQVSSNNFADVACNSTYYNNVDYCQLLYTSLDVKKVIVTNSDLTNVNNTMKQSPNNNNYDDSLRELISKSPDTSDGYQVFVEFNDGSVAVVWMGEA